MPVAAVFDRDDPSTHDADGQCRAKVRLRLP